jgi:LysM repeat protein
LILLTQFGKNTFTMKVALFLTTLSVAVAIASPSAFAAKDSTKPAPAAEKVKSPTATGYTVKSGDNLAKIARALGTTSDNLAKANDLAPGAVIRPGQALKIPAKTVAKTAPAKPQTAPAAKNTANTHQVQAGETFYSISKKHGISAAALAAANPTAVPTALKLGQILNLSTPTPPKPSKPEASTTAKVDPPTKAAAPEEIKPTPTPQAKDTAAANTPPAPYSEAKAPAPVTQSIAPRETKPAVEASKSPTLAPSATPPAAAPAAAGPKYITATVDSETTLGDFAAKHGADAKRLNELNGLDLTTETVLAKGSELIVPIQP